MRPIKHWHIEYSGAILDQSGDVRRMVAMYKALHNIDQASAIAALITAGYAQLVTKFVPPAANGTPPPRIDGRVDDGCRRAYRGESECVEVVSARYGDRK